MMFGRKIVRHITQSKTQREGKVEERYSGASTLFSLHFFVCVGCIASQKGVQISELFEKKKVNWELLLIRIKQKVRILGISLV